MADRSHSLKPIAAVVGVAFVSSLALSQPLQANENPFSAADLDTGYMLASETPKGEEGSCGENKGEDGKCGEGKCGEAEGESKGEDGKCGEGKCGEAKDESKGEEGKCGEGKCGEGKCGEDTGEKGEEGACGEHKGDDGKCGGRA